MNLRCINYLVLLPYSPKFVQEKVDRCHLNLVQRSPPQLFTTAGAPMQFFIFPGNAEDQEEIRSIKELIFVRAAVWRLHHTISIIQKHGGRISKDRKSAHMILTRSITRSPGLDTFYRFSFITKSVEEGVLQVCGRKPLSRRISSFFDRTKKNSSCKLLREVQSKNYLSSIIKIFFRNILLKSNRFFLPVPVSGSKIAYSAAEDAQIIEYFKTHPKNTSEKQYYLTMMNSLVGAISC